jgi:hypothetical protein
MLTAWQQEDQQSRLEQLSANDWRLRVRARG